MRAAPFAIALLIANSFLMGLSAPARAAVTSSGNISPASLGDWNSNATCYVGKTDDGSLQIDGGSDLQSRSARLGNDSGKTGTVGISGDGSTWTIGRNVFVGYNGIGRLTLEKGAIFTTATSGSSYFSEIGDRSGSSGAVTVNHATWTNGGGVNIGSAGSGKLSILSSGTVSTVGLTIGAAGAVSVEGNGSTLSNGSGNFYVSGGLTVADGAVAQCTSTGWLVNIVGNGRAVIRNEGSAFSNNSGSLWLGLDASGGGALIVADGGRVSASSLDLNSATSMLSIDVGRGSSITVGGGSTKLTNAGEMRFMAGAGMAAGATDTPIVSGAWEGTGVYRPFGGTIDIGGTHEFTASTVADGTSGNQVSLDLSLQQRVLVDDAASGWSVGVSLPHAGTSTHVGVTATVADVAELAALRTAAPGANVLGAWMLETDNYAVSEADPLYLSLWVGDARTLADLTLWHYDGGAWTDCTSALDDLARDGQYVSFSVTSLSGYAVTTPVPEPRCLTLLALFLAGMAVILARRM